MADVITVTFKLAYSANGGSGAPAEVSVPQRVTAGTSASQSFTVSSTNPSRTYYNFLGWSTSSSATSASYTGGSSITLNFSGGYGDATVTRTLYAVWQHQTVYVYYDANGGSGAPSKQSHWAGYSVTLSATIPTRAGYNFLGWATSASATSAQYQPNTAYPLYRTVTLYAVWQPASSKLSTSNGTLGTAQTITITRYVSTYTETITYSFGSASGTIATKTNAGSVSWTPPTSLASQIPNSKTGTCTLTCTTYNGNTVVGTSSITITLTVPQSLAPTVSVSFVDTIAKCLEWGLFVQSRSKLAFTITASGKQGASITSYSTQVNGSTFNAASFTTDVLLYNGSNSYSVTVTDSRGLKTVSTGTFSVVAYSNPSLTLTLCDRNDSDSEQIDIGFNYAVSAVSNNNESKYRIDYKLKSASTWTNGTVQNLGSYSGSISYSIADRDGGEEWDIRVNVIDSFQTSTIESEVGVSGNILLNSRHQGGLGILMKSQANDQCDIGKIAVCHDGIDNVQRRCYASLSSAGWYRVLTYVAEDSGGAMGGQGLVVDFNIVRATNAENHSITMRCVSGGGVSFTNESSKSNQQLIDKIRYTYNTTSYEAYVDIHYTGTAARVVGVIFGVYAATLAYAKAVTSNNLTAVADAPSGETVLTTYEFSANTYEGLAYKGYAKTFSTDFNGITEQGVYYLDNTTMTNAPSNYQWSYLIVLTNHGTIQVTQMVVYTTSNAPMQVFSTRQYAGSPASWGTWRNPRMTSLGDLSYTGTLSSNNSGDISLENGTWTNLCSFTLPAGRWFIWFTARFNSNTSGRREARVTTSTSASGGAYSVNLTNAVAPVNGTYTFVKGEDYVNSSDTTFYLNAYQNSGSALTAIGRLYAFRIC